MKFDKEMLKKAAPFLPKDLSHPILDMLNDDAYCDFYNKFASPMEDLLFLAVFGEGFVFVHDAFNCPGNDDGLRPIAWDRGFIVDRFTNCMKNANIDGMMKCLIKLEECWDNFYGDDDGK